MEYLRRQSNRTQKEIAQAANISPELVCKIERLKWPVDRLLPETVAKIENAYGRPLNELAQQGSVVVQWQEEKRSDV